MAKTLGPITWNEDNGHTLADWRARWPEKLVTRNDDGLVCVRDADVGSESRGALWHLSDYHVVAVTARVIYLQVKALID